MALNFLNNGYFAGKVGIGTTTPLANLDIGNDSGSIYQRWSYDNPGANNYFLSLSETVTSGNVRFCFNQRNAGTNYNNVLVFNQGNVGIGTDSPVNKLNVNGDIGYIGVIGQGSIYGNTGNSSFSTMQLYDPATGYTTLNNQSYGYYFNTSGGTKVTILNGGNVGINTTSPEEKLHVIGSALISNNEFYKVENTTGTNYKIAGLTNGNVIQIGAIDYTSAGTIFAGGDNISITTGGASGSTRMKIDSSGNVGVGISNPNKKFVVKSPGADNGIFLLKNSTSGIIANIIETGSGDGALLLATNAAATSVLLRGSGNNYINSGNVGIGTTSPGTKLVIEGTNDAAGTGVVEIKTTGTNLKIGGNTTYSWIQSHASKPLYINQLGNNVILNLGGGRVGIGTTGPDEKLTVNGITRAVDPIYFGAINTDNGTYGPYIESYDDKGLKFDFNGNTGGEFQIWNHDANGGGATEVFTIEDDNNIFMPSSNVTIGKTTSALGALDVDGTFIVSVGTQVRFRVFYTSNYTFVNGGTNGSTIYFGAPTSNVQNIRVQGTATATNFILSSDEILKDNIKNIDNKHIDVDWKNFELKSEPGVKRAGVIAQELEKKHPEFVRTDEEGLKSVAYIDLLIAKIAELEARLEKAGL